jgi:hypothetical protein
LSEATSASETAAYLGLDQNFGLVGWDIYDAILRSGDLILKMAWKAKAGADAFANSVKLPEAGRLRQLRLVPDYRMFDRARRHDRRVLLRVTEGPGEPRAAPFGRHERTREHQATPLARRTSSGR